MSSPQSKVIILTGASRGIGLAIAQFLLSHNHLLVLIARTESPLHALESQFPNQTIVLPGDVTNSELASQAVGLAVTKWNRIDGLILNHGTLEPVTKISDASMESWRLAFDINFFSAVAFLRAALPELKKSRGRVVLTSSGAATTGYQGWGAYGSSKAALNHLCLTVANEEREIVCVAIRPGVVDTDMQRDIREKHKAAMAESEMQKFIGLSKRGELLKAERPAEVIARLVIGAGWEVSGKFLSWNADELKAFRE